MARTRTYYTQEERDRLLTEYRGGTHTPAEFAASRGLRVGTFRTWLSRHPPIAAARSPSPPSEPPRFVAVVPDPAATTRAEIELRIGTVTVSLPSELGSDFLAELILRLASGSC